ncbi:HAD family hydrolase [Maricaulis virginensis]|uniref:Haloacid dehalogenase n=1 Tax=Maricaulis virginensis TaxID=144022 RepID=A0A9W6IPB8_9PROT|nr:HAD family hydrolase [Maricaulis virginensis]GLK52854.1 haloacid dehalogenase [Maricaulis virginensis]
MITTLAFDADDTLWHNERFYRLTEESFTAMLADYAEPDHLSERLLEAERRNLKRYGYGIKGFVLSMIETAVEVTENRVPAATIRQILDASHDMLEHPVELLPHVRDTVEALTPHYRTIIVTKGDLMDQERKIAASGLAELFDGIEIVSEKTPDIYRSIFDRHGDGAERAMMVGNSMRSDVVPAIEAGSWGVHVPHGLTWALEHAEAPAGHPRFREIGDLGGLPGLLDTLR